MTRLILPANGRDLPPAPHVEVTGELHIVAADGTCGFIAGDGTRCAEDHRSRPEPGWSLFAGDPDPDAGFALEPKQP